MRTSKRARCINCKCSMIQRSGKVCNFNFVASNECFEIAEMHKKSLECSLNGHTTGMTLAAMSGKRTLQEWRVRTSSCLYLSVSSCSDTLLVLMTSFFSTITSCKKKRTIQVLCLNRKDCLTFNSNYLPLHEKLKFCLVFVYM